MIDSVDKLCNSIWYLEEKHSLFNQKAWGQPFWNMVRMRVYYCLAKQLSIFGDPHPVNRNLKWKITFVFGLLVGVIRNVTKLPSLVTANVIVVEHHRTKELDENLSVDIYSYYYVKERLNANENVLVFSRTCNGVVEKTDDFQRFNIDSILLFSVFLGRVFANLNLLTQREFK